MSQFWLDDVINAKIKKERNKIAKLQKENEELMEMLRDGQFRGVVDGDPACIYCGFIKNSPIGKHICKLNQMLRGEK